MKALHGTARPANARRGKRAVAGWEFTEIRHFNDTEALLTVPSIEI